MNLNGVFSIAGALVGVTAITVIVSHKESANVIRAIIGGFSGALLAAQGKR